MNQQQKELLAARDYIQRSIAVLDKAGYARYNPTMVDLHSAISRIDTDLFVTKKVAI